MKEKSNGKSSPLQYDRSLPVFNIIEGMVLVGAKCSECHEEWAWGDNLKMPHQFLSKFADHARSKHALDPNAHLQYLYKEKFQKRGAEPKQTTVYTSKNSWE